LGEGWDLPILDTVVIAEKMTSQIRIVQSLLRPCRKNILLPEKTMKIILPILNIDDLTENIKNDDFNKVRDVIYQLSLEDHTILTKIKLYKLKENKENNSGCSGELGNGELFGEYEKFDDTFEKKFLLSIIDRKNIGLAQYNKIKKIIHNKFCNIIKCKVDYYDHYIEDQRLPAEPEKIFGSKFDWIDYLSIERKYYNVDECNEIGNKYLLQEQHKYLLTYCITNILLVRKKLCEIDNKFPPFDLWDEYYKKDVNKIIFSYRKKMKSGIEMKNEIF
jgi:hypothetical protein